MNEKGSVHMEIRTATMADLPRVAAVEADHSELVKD